jgi:hypothetical protein
MLLILVRCLNKEFIEARCDYWLSWLGCPMLYDGGLFVNRSIDEINESVKYRTVGSTI